MPRRTVTSLPCDFIDVARSGPEIEPSIKRRIHTGGAEKEPFPNLPSVSLVMTSLSWDQAAHRRIPVCVLCFQAGDAMGDFVGAVDGDDY